MDALSVQETYFWREIDQIRALDVPRAARARARRAAAGRSGSGARPCATGEEPLTIAMALEEARLVRPRADRDPRQRRQPGGDRQGARRRLPAARVPRAAGRSARSISSPAARISSPVAALTPAHLVVERRQSHGPRRRCAACARSPVVFCRNAFIYFSHADREASSSAFAEAMPAPGFLFVGASESLLSVSDRFVLEDLERAFVYVKR